MNHVRVPHFATAFARSPQGALSLLWLTALVVVAIAAPFFLHARANLVDVLSGGQNPTPAHWLGTDALGRDILARTLVATRLSLELAAAASLVSAAIGLPVGAAIGLLGPRSRTVAMRVIDALLSFPDILIAIFAVAILGTSAVGAALGVGLSAVPWFARLAATLSFSVVGKEYVVAARALGVGRTTILRRYVLANMAEPLVVAVALILGYSLIAVSSLSFLGVGVQPPDYDWGRLLTQGVQAIYETPLAALAPALMIASTGVLFGLAGDSLATAMNPTIWTAPPRRRTWSLMSLLSRPSKGARVGTTRTVRGETPSRLVKVDGLTIRARGAGETVEPVRDLTFSMRHGDIVGIVGESGSGKTLTTLAIAGLLPAQLEAKARSIELAGHDVLHLSARDRRKALGGRVAVIFQDPLASLNPALRIGTQMTEGIRVHKNADRAEAKARAIKRLEEVLVSAPETRLHQYPHQLSGGIRQRVMIAMGLMTEPDLIIADEPTTALDVTVQSEVLEVLREANRRHGAGIIFVSHNLAVIAELCNRIAVMYGGRIVEEALTRELLESPLHPYSRALIGAVPPSEPTHDSLIAIPGAPPDPRSMPAGCPFAPRCPVRLERCSSEMPPLLESSDGRRVACWVSRPAPAAMEQVPA